MDSEQLMRLALKEAARGGREVRPNPRVGSALRSADGRIVAGFHARCGGPHAEAAMLAACTEQGIDPRGASVAVTLEPCSHFGRTPPCADALIRAGVARVYVGVLDPHPKVSGKGIHKLKAAGIEVQVGVVGAECESLNREWLQAHRKGRSFVTAKMATSLDGLWTAASGKSQWITGSSARSLGHELRARVDAIVTGAGTVRVDNPRLSARKGERELPDQPRVFVLSQSEAPDLKGTALEGRGESRRVEDLEAFLQELHQAGLHDVLIEAGPRLSHAFLNAGLVDEVWLFLGARMLGGDGQRLGALAGGGLPGLEFDVLESKVLPEGDLFVKLASKTLTLT